MIMTCVWQRVKAKKAETEEAACKAAEVAEVAVEDEQREVEEACEAERAVAHQEMMEDARWRLQEGVEAVTR